MIIKVLFEKPIDRDIKGVIKVGQDDDSNVRQELEEYVVTGELQRHFRDFFAAYVRSFKENTDKMGVWISGFFGSGKSHFLKILSYLLGNVEVDGKRAIDYFIEDDKIKDPFVLGNMKLAGQVPTDVILFNIDSKSEMTGKQSKDAIVSVFLRVFNEKLGFCGSMPYLADLERKLTADGRYEEFKTRIEASVGQPWEEIRNDFFYNQDAIVDVFVEMNFMSEEAARNWCEKASGDYKISIEDFAKMVKRYIDQRGNDHHVVFLVDEIGQYIGDDTQLMLNLQTVTEDLGRICNGKAWVIVTSQQDIDSITKTKGNDFSKIQGRFDTRLSLSSANVDEVIRERILKKTETGNQTLSILYDSKETVLKNLILFNDGVEKKLYAGRMDFAAVYPFIPYQFNLLGDVLTSIRMHGASGKHLSEGERSMLAMFKESAVKVMEDEPGRLVPFHMFYDALEKFLDHSHSGVITKALKNDMLNPEHAESCFDVDVLKTLFMIKYVKEIQANLEQITSLMVSHIDDDRLALKDKVEDALRRLIGQTLVQKNGDIYIFLTEEEQEVEREIERQSQNLEQSQIIAKVSEYIFDGFYDERKYRYPAFNGRYQFAFNQVVDGRPYKSNQSNELTLKILTPYSDERADDQTMRILSSQSRCVLVVLPNDRAFLDEIRMVMSIDNFMRLDSMNTITKYEQIKAAKKVEALNRTKSAKVYLSDALKDADIYVSGDKIQTSSRDIKTRINEAMGKLVSQVYHKLSYIDTSVSESDVRALLHSNQQQITMEGVNTAKNSLALGDVASRIGSVTDNHMKTSMKSLMDRFMKAPYGFVEVDVQWLVTKLFRNGDIAFYVNNEPVTLINKTEEEIFRFITRKEYLERLMMDRREKATERQKKAVRDVMKDLFKGSCPSDEDDVLMQKFLDYARSWQSELGRLSVWYDNQPKYPGKEVISRGKTMIATVLSYKHTGEFFQGIDSKRNDYTDLADDFAPVKSFFDGEQRKIFDDSLSLMKIYDESKTFVVDAELESAVKGIREILQMKSPFINIYKLPGLNDQFRNRYGSILEEMSGPVYGSVKENRQRVLDELDQQTTYKEQCNTKFRQKVIDRFEELNKKTESCNNVASLKNIPIEADALKIRFLNEISQYITELTPQPKEDEAPVNYLESLDPGDHGRNNVLASSLPKVKKNKTYSLKDISTSTSWQLESQKDVDMYVNLLRTKLISLLKENTIVHIEL
ncbi:MAG: BREX system P-loop protein BrxC [Clostridia bacterium]|nr:BREX system P-loop protein BrxC [Clostridia bacterium]